MRRIGYIATVLALVTASAASASVGWNSANWSGPNATKTKLSAFAVAEKESGESGFGAAITQTGPKTLDISYMKVDSFSLYQISQLAAKQIGPFMVNFGFTTAWAKRAAGIADPTTPDNMMTGISLVLAKSASAGGISLDIRASSLSKEFNPIAWFSDPDVFWIGAGLSYGF